MNPFMFFSQSLMPTPSAGWVRYGDIGRILLLIGVLGLVQWVAVPAFSNTTYNATLDTSAAPVPMPTLRATAPAEIPFSPVVGRLTSLFGWRQDPYNGQSRFHSGIDIGAPTGTPVFVPQDGVVTYSGRYKGYGNLVAVFHPPNLYTLYGHNSQLLVTRGQQVRAGTPIALVGSTGRSTGPHLHFEVRQNTGYVDPIHYLNYIQALNQNPMMANQRYHQWRAASPFAPVPMAPATQTGGPEINPNASAYRRTLSTTPQHRGKTVEVIRGSDVEIVQF